MKKTNEFPLCDRTDEYPKEDMGVLKECDSHNYEVRL